MQQSYSIQHNHLSMSLKVSTFHLQEEERRMAEELAEVARLRQEAVHKAQPMPKYKPMVIQASRQPLTAAQSPNFATNARLRSRSQANSTYSVDM